MHETLESVNSGEVENIPIQTQRDPTQNTVAGETIGNTFSTTDETADPGIESVKPTVNHENTGAAQLTEYEKYIAMSGEDQQAFMESFEDIPAFLHGTMRQRKNMKTVKRILRSQGTRLLTLKTF